MDNLPNVVANALCSAHLLTIIITAQQEPQPQRRQQQQQSPQQQQRRQLGRLRKKIDRTVELAFATTPFNDERQNQCDLMFEFKVAQLCPKVAQKVATALFT